MRTTLFTTAASFLLAFALAACGGRGDGSTTRDMGHGLDAGRDMSGSSTDMGTTTHDMGSTTMDMSTGTDLGHSGDAAMCVPHCSINFDCQMSCPAVTGHVQCCDTASGHCFGTTGSVCPSGGSDGGSGGGDGSMYM